MSAPARPHPLLARRPTLVRRMAVALLALSAPLLQGAQSPAGDGERNWQAISAEPGKRIEIDRASVKREEGGRVSAWGRIMLDKDLPDSQSGQNYRSIEALGRYDCSNRSYATLKRVYVKVSGQPLREESVKVAADMPVRSNTLDDKLLRDVCRPTSPSELRQAAKSTVGKVNAAAGELRKVNEQLVQQAVEREAPKVAPKAAVPAPEPSDHMEIRRPRPAPAYASALPPAPRPRAVSRAEAAPAASEHRQLHWSYEGDAGPDFWGRINPEFATCDKGRRQSPIDIWDGIRVDLPPIEFNYRPTRFRLVDDGRTLVATPGRGSLTHLGKTYDLVQIRFHHPAEVRVNGKSFDMAAHLIHRSDDNQLAVVAVPLEKGSENPVIQTLWNYIPLERNQEVVPPDASLDLNQLLPEKRGYATYMGSLSTPPCTEGVLWLVMQRPVQISAEQVAIFSRLYRNNARPIQPANGRLIKESR